MYVLWIVLGTAFFTFAFIALGAGVGALSEKHHTGLAFAVLAAGLALLLILTTTYGRVVR